MISSRALSFRFSFELDVDGLAVVAGGAIGYNLGFFSDSSLESKLEIGLSWPFSSLTAFKLSSFDSSLLISVFFFKKLILIAKSK